jgi:hypothetical protein
MLRNILTIFSFLFIFSVNSCQKAPDTKPQAATGLEHLPQWVIDPSIEGKIAAVGMAPKSSGGVQFQIPQAEADARANIAAQINVEISRLTKNALREARVAGNDDVENVFTQVTKNVVKKIPLMGAKRVNMFRDITDGSLYIQMAIDNEMISEYMKQNRRLISNGLRKSDLPQKRINEAQRAVKELYEELDKEIK